MLQIDVVKLRFISEKDRGDLLRLLETTLAFLLNGEANTLAARDGDQRLLAVANHEHIANTGGESMSLSVADAHDIERTWMAHSSNDGTDTALVMSCRDHGKVANLELNEFGDLAGLQVNLDGVVDANERIWIAKGAAIMGDGIRNGGHLTSVVGVLSNRGLVALRQFLDTAKLETSLFLVNGLQQETALSVVQHTEVLIGLLDRQHI